MKEFTTVTTKRMDEDAYNRLISWAFKWYDLFVLVTELSGGIFDEMPRTGVKISKEEFERIIQMEISEGAKKLTARHIGQLVSPVYYHDRFNGTMGLRAFGERVDGGWNGSEFEFARYVTEEKSLKD